MLFPLLRCHNLRLHRKHFIYVKVSCAVPRRARALAWAWRHASDDSALHSLCPAPPQSVPPRYTRSALRMLELNTLIPGLVGRSQPNPLQFIRLIREIGNVCLGSQGKQSTTMHSGTIVMKSASAVGMNLVIACLAPVAGWAAGSKDIAPTEPLQIADALHLKAFASHSPISLSPDGALVAYTLADGSKRQSTGDSRYEYFTRSGVFVEAVGGDVWITATQSGKSESLTEGKGTNWGPVWSPDGKFLAFYSDRSGSASLWVWERATRQFRQLSDAIVRPFFNFEVVRWSPDSKKILVKVLPEGLDLEQAADTISGPVKAKKDADAAHSESTSGATVVVYTNLPTQAKKNAGQKAEAKAGTKEVLDEKWMNRYSGDLALVDLASGNIEHITRGTRPLSYWFSPDGKYIAYTNCMGIEANTQRLVYQIELFNLNDRSSRVLVPRVQQAYGVQVSWSPDSKSIAYFGNDEGEKADCFVVSIAGGLTRNLTEGKHPSFAAEFRAPLWDYKGDFIYLISAPIDGRSGTDTIWKAPVHGANLSVLAQIHSRVVNEILAPQYGGIFWSPDNGQSLVVATTDAESKQVGLYKVDTETGKAFKIFEKNARFGDLIFKADNSQDGQTLVYVEQDAQCPEDIWVSDADFKNCHRLSNINSVVSALTLGKSRLIDWRSMDGLPLRGALLLPANFDPARRYPLIVYVYGGSYGSGSVYRFGLAGPVVDNLQLLATRGYAVLVPDCPLAKGTPMRDLFRTVNPAVDKVVQLGIADPDRIGIMGHSYGGYSTLALIVQTNRFRAAVDSAGISDLISLYGQMDDSGASPNIGWCETGQGGMVGTPWQFRDRYIENSPVFYLDRVSTPLLITNGELDDATPHAQAEEVFVGLRRLGKEVVYAKYRGEGHWQGTWSYLNVVDYWSRVLQWLDQHLQK
jgi:dipeptidyl aminopeptidase/acylaminoacyl peptidase